ncbi:MAG: hypothetical protein C4320_00230 [Armatimonadota bacterium]
MLRAFVIALLALLASFGSAQIQWKAVASGERTRITASIEPGWHLYSVKPVKGEGPVPTSFKRSGAALSAKEITTPIEKFDKNFGIPVLYFAERAEFEVSGKPDGISATYQLCNDRVCLPPKTVEITAGRSATAAPTRPTGDVSAQVSAAQKAGFLPFIALAFGFGLLALLTPCVFPMIPITVSYFSKEKERGGKPVPSAIAFCLGIIGTYTVFGVGITLLFGASSVQSFGTSPWVNLALGALSSTWH